MSLTRTSKIICDTCGRFVNYEDLANGEATHFLVEPDSDRSRERFESECARCVRKECDARKHSTADRTEP